MKRPLGFVKFFVILLIPIALEMLFVVVLDPFFHYHAPGRTIPYRLSADRYQNDGIVKNFEYNAIISGSSETQNFSASYFEDLMDVTAVKVSFGNGTLKEVDSLIRNALSNNDNVKYVLRSLDLHWLIESKDYLTYDDYPEYLYDSNPLNDYQYLFNKEVVLEAAYRLLMWVTHMPSTTFDDYGSFYKDHLYSKDAVLANYTRLDAMSEQQILTDDAKNVIFETVNQNIIETAVNNPDVTFYYFIPPYSILFWDGVNRSGQMSEVIERMDYTVQLLLSADNIKVFSFCDCYDLITNLDRYMDTLHYDYEASQMILEKISNDEGLLTAENYRNHLNEVYDYYINYDYDSIFVIQ